MLLLISISSGAGSADLLDDVSNDEDEYEYINTKYKSNNGDGKEADAGDNEEDDDDNNFVEERDTFDLQCDGGPADDSFASEAFSNAVQLLAGNDESSRPQRALSNKNARTNMNDDDDDPPPERPDVSGMNDDEAASAIKAWRVQRKRWTDPRARLRRNQRIGNADLLSYTGDSSPVLRLMSVVQQRRLLSGDSFQSKDTLRMRIAEEANLANKEITTVRSDNMQLVVVGVDFYVKANHTERKGWVVSKAICRDGDGSVPKNAATQKIRYLGRQCDSGTIDLSRSDEDEEGGKCLFTYCLIISFLIIHTPNVHVS